MMSDMALRGAYAFDEKTHAELLRLAPHLSDIELAAKFGVSLPTVQKYKSLPVDHVRPQRGRPIVNRDLGDEQEELSA